MSSGTPTGKPAHETPAFCSLKRLRTGTPRARTLILCALAGALLLWNAATSLYVMRVGFSPLPFGDQWDACLFPDHFIRTLFAQHNEHRPALCRLVALLDWYLADARNVINLSFIALCYPAFCLALFKLVNMIVADWRRAALYTALVSAVIVSAEQQENLLWGFQTAFVGSFIFAFVALLFGCLAALPAGSAAARAALAGLCFAASFFAVFSLASGLLVLIFVPVLFFIIGAPAKQKYGYAAFAAGIFLFYFHGYVRPVHDPNPWPSLGHVWSVGGFILVYIGSPFSAGRPDLAAGAGGLGVLLLLVLIANSIVGLRKDNKFVRTPAGAAYVALLLFAILIVCAGGLTALGRLDFGIVQAMSSRYRTPALMFWGDLLAICLVQPAVRADQPSRIFRRGGAILGVVLALAVAVTQLHYVRSARLSRANKFKAVIAYLIGIRNQQAVLALYPLAKAVAKGLLDARFQGLERARKSIFADNWADRLGTPLHRWKGEPQKGCRGAIEGRTPVPEQKAPISELAGWAWDDVRERVPDLIAFTDAQDLIVGFAAPGYQRDDVRRAQAGIGSSYTGWDGFARADMVAALRAYGIFFNRPDRTCEFGTDTRRQ